MIENGTIKVKDGKIEKVGAKYSSTGDDVKVYDVKGKQVYPGLILPTSDMGIREIGGNKVRGSNDFFELGDYNPNVRTIVAYNADTRIAGTLRANGILLANTIPQGGLIPGSSSVVQLDAWNYEDAAYKTDGGMHLYMPSLRTQGGGRWGWRECCGINARHPISVKEGLDKVDAIKGFFRMPKAYLQKLIMKKQI